LAFEWFAVKKLATIGDAIRFIAELTPEQRDQYWWKVAMVSMNSAIREPKTRWCMGFMRTNQLAL
jgi:hypothetical protein